MPHLKNNGKSEISIRMLYSNYEVNWKSIHNVKCDGKRMKLNILILLKTWYHIDKHIKEVVIFYLQYFAIGLSWIKGN